MINENKQEQTQETKEQDRFAGFRTYYANGRAVIDLESVDEDWSAYESFNRAEDIERQAIYGDKSGSSKL